MASLVCPMCKHILIRAGTVVKPDGRHEHYECPRCGYLYTVHFNTDWIANKSGHWVHETTSSYSDRIYCSECKTPAPYIYVCRDPYGRDMHGEYKETNFCPECGADMRK